MSHENNTLNKLVDICEDARRFYADAITKTENPDMKRLFRDMGDIRKSIIIDLRQHMRAKGYDVDEADGTFVGKANQFIGEKVANMTNNVDNALVTYLEEAEDRCLHAFQDACEDKDLSADTQLLLRGCLPTLQKTHDYMRDLKELISKKQAAA